MTALCLPQERPVTFCSVVFIKHFVLLEWKVLKKNPASSLPAFISASQLRRWKDFTSVNELNLWACCEEDEHCLPPSRESAWISWLYPTVAVLGVKPSNSDLQALSLIARLFCHVYFSPFKTCVRTGPNTISLYAQMAHTQSHITAGLGTYAPFVIQLHGK